MEELKKKGWYLSENGLKCCISALDLKTDHYQVNDIIKVALNLDLHHIGDNVLPENINSGQCTLVNGPIVLQVHKLSNISAPSINQESSSAPRLLKLFLTDGKLTCVAIEYTRLLDISTDYLIPGTKVCLLGPTSIINGVILLEHGNFIFLGGQVARLKEKWDMMKKTFLNRKIIGTNSGPPPFLEFDPAKVNDVQNVKNRKTDVPDKLRDLQNEAKQNENLVKSGFTSLHSKAGKQFMPEKSVFMKAKKNARSEKTEEKKYTRDLDYKPSNNKLSSICPIQIQITNNNQYNDKFQSESNFKNKNENEWKSQLQSNFSDRNDFTKTEKSLNLEDRKLNRCNKNDEKYQENYKKTAFVCYDAKSDKWTTNEESKKFSNDTQKQEGDDTQKSSLLVNNFMQDILPRDAETNLQKTTHVKDENIYIQSSSDRNEVDYRNKNQRYSRDDTVYTQRYEKTLDDKKYIQSNNITRDDKKKQQISNTSRADRKSSFTSDNTGNQKYHQPVDNTRDDKKYARPNNNNRDDKKYTQPMDNARGDNKYTQSSDNNRDVKKYTRPSDNNRDDKKYTQLSDNNRDVKKYTRPSDNNQDDKKYAQSSDNNRDDKKYIQSSDNNRDDKKYTRPSDNNRDDKKYTQLSDNHRDDKKYTQSSDNNRDNKKYTRPTDNNRDDKKYIQSSDNNRDDKKYTRPSDNNRYDKKYTQLSDNHRDDKKYTRPSDNNQDDKKYTQSSDNNRDDKKYTQSSDNNRNDKKYKQPNDNTQDDKKSPYSEDDGKQIKSYKNTRDDRKQFQSRDNTRGDKKYTRTSDNTQDNKKYAQTSNNTRDNKKYAQPMDNTRGDNKYAQPSDNTQDNKNNTQLSDYSRDDIKKIQPSENTWVDTKYIQPSENTWVDRKYIQSSDNGKNSDFKKDNLSEQQDKTKGFQINNQQDLQPSTLNENKKHAYTNNNKNNSKNRELYSQKDVESNPLSWNKNINYVRQKNIETEGSKVVKNKYNEQFGGGKKRNYIHTNNCNKDSSNRKFTTQGSNYIQQKDNSKGTFQKYGDENSLQNNYRFENQSKDDENIEIKQHNGDNGRNMPKEHFDYKKGIQPLEREIHPVITPIPTFIAERVSDLSNLKRVSLETLFASALKEDDHKGSAVMNHSVTSINDEVQLYKPENLAAYQAAVPFTHQHQMLMQQQAYFQWMMAQQTFNPQFMQHYQGSSTYYPYQDHIYYDKEDVYGGSHYASENNPNLYQQ